MRKVLNRLTLAVCALCISGILAMADADLTVTLSQFTTDISGAGHIVQLIPNAGGTRQGATTDSDGVASFSSVAPGFYTMNILDGGGTYQLRLKPSDSGTLSAWDALTSEKPNPTANKTTLEAGDNVTIQGKTVSASNNGVSIGSNTITADSTPSPLWNGAAWPGVWRNDTNGTVLIPVWNGPGFLNGTNIFEMFNDNSSVDSGLRIDFGFGTTISHSGINNYNTWIGVDILNDLNGASYYTNLVDSTFVGDDIAYGNKIADTHDFVGIGDGVFFGSVGSSGTGFTNCSSFIGIGNYTLSGVALHDSTGVIAIGANAGAGLSGTFNNVIMLGDNTTVTGSNQAVIGNASHAYKFPGTGGITTADPGSGTAAWKVGQVITGASVSLVTTNYVEVNIGGTVVKLAIVK